MMKIVNQTVPIALRRLGYGDTAIADIIEYIDQHDTIEGAPELQDDDLAVFDCAFKAAQGQAVDRVHGPHRDDGARRSRSSRGAISKTVNVPSESSIEDIKQAYIEAGSSASRRSPSIATAASARQPLATQHRQDHRPGASRWWQRPLRRRLPAERTALTHQLRHRRATRATSPSGCTRTAHPARSSCAWPRKARPSRGLMDSLRHRDLARPAVRRAAAGAGGQVLAHAVRSAGLHQEPRDPDCQVDDGLHLPLAGVALPLDRGARSARHHPPRRATGRRSSMEISSGSGWRSNNLHCNGGRTHTPRAPQPISMGMPGAFVNQEDAPTCSECGSLMVRNGACYKCHNCGATSGCS